VIFSSQPLVIGSIALFLDKLYIWGRAQQGRTEAIIGGISFVHSKLILEVKRFMLSLST